MPQFQPPLRLLHKGDESQRRWKIIDAGRSGDPRYVRQLLARLESDETLENKRHVVRALGHLGGDAAIEKLIEFLGSSEDLLLGDVIHSLGEQNVQQAKPEIAARLSHDTEWVRQNAVWALDQFERQ